MLLIPFTAENVFFLLHGLESFTNHQRTTTAAAPQTCQAQLDIIAQQTKTNQITIHPETERYQAYMDLQISSKF